MPIFKMSFSAPKDCVTLVNHGCNYSCSICSYRLREGAEPKRFFDTWEVKAYLERMNPSTVVIMGGEPTTWANIFSVARFCKEHLKAFIRIPHSNLSNSPPPEVDEIGVSLFAISKRKYLQLTGSQNSRVLSNIYKTYDQGTRIFASAILIPEFIGKDELIKVAEFIASIDRDIPLHITSYLPVPNMPWRRPSRDEMRDAVEYCLKVLKNVTGTFITATDFTRINYMRMVQDVRLA